MTSESSSIGRLKKCLQVLLMHKPFPLRLFRREPKHDGKRKIARCGTNNNTAAKNANSFTRLAGSWNSVPGGAFCGRSEK